MTTSKHGPPQLANWHNSRPVLESLPGQLSLFEEAPRKLVAAETEVAVTQRGELFDSGRDLPGADETDQIILWDIS